MKGETSLGRDTHKCGVRETITKGAHRQQSQTVGPLILHDDGFHRLKAIMTHLVVHVLAPFVMPLVASPGASSKHCGTGYFGG